MADIPGWFFHAWRYTSLTVDGVYALRLTTPLRKRNTARALWTYMAVLEGRARVRQGGWAGELGPGDQALMLQDHPFTQESVQVPLVLLTIDFRVQSTLLASDPLPLLGLPAVVHTEPEPEWKALCLRSAELHGPKSRYTAKSLVGRGIADTLVTAYLFAGIEEGLIAASRRVPVPDWLATIHQDLASLPKNRDVVDMDKVAEKSGYSRSHFYSEYTRVFGETPMATVWKGRLAVAAQRLDSDPTISISAIAAQCAFKSHSHFSQVFHRHYGMTPAEWRRRHLNAVKPVKGRE